jgi:hypothetical protein
MSKICCLRALLLVAPMMVGVINLANTGRSDSFSIL